MKLLEYALFNTVITVIVGITLFLNGMHEPSIPIVFWWFISMIVCIVMLFMGEIFYDDYQTQIRECKFQEVYEMLREGD